MIGVARRNENFAPQACHQPPVIVIPEREMPGSRARAWAAPVTAAALKLPPPAPWGPRSKLEVPQLFARPATVDLFALSAVLAGVGAYLSARFLIRWFRSGRLDPYGWYCLGAGVLAFILVR